MSEELHWYYVSNGEQQGPITGDQLQELAASGTLTPETPVWTETLEEWTTASEVEGLFPAAAAQPASTGPRLITGAAAQTAAPLAAAQAAPVAQPVAQPGFSLGGSLAGGPHAAPVGATPASLSPGAEQRLQIRSVGILQTGVVFACISVVTMVLYSLMFMIFGGAILGATGMADEAPGLAAGGLIVLVFGSVFGAIFGFIYGLVLALIYNLAAKMCGGIIIKVQARGAW